MALAYVTNSKNSAQGNNVATLSCAFGAATAIGDLLVAHIGWNDAGSYTEISANHPHIADGVMTRATGNACVAGNGLTETIYYIEATSAATHTVGVDWGANQPYIDIRVQAFTGFTGTPTLDEVAGATGISSNSSTGNSGVTDDAAEVVVAGGMTVSSYPAGDPTTGYTQNWLTSPNNDCWGSKVTSSTGVQVATGTPGEGGNYAWAMTLATFKNVAGEKSAAITGTATESINESNIVAGGKTIVITLTGDTFIA